MAADTGTELNHGIAGSEKRPGIKDLPIETQEGIIKHVGISFIWKCLCSLYGSLQRTTS